MMRVLLDPAENVPGIAAPLADATDVVWLSPRAMPAAADRPALADPGWAPVDVDD